MSIIVLYFILYVVINSVPAFFIAIGAARRDMNSAKWFLIVTFSSLIGIVIYFFVREPKAAGTDEQVSIEIPVEILAERKCPECNAYMKDDEKVCGLCGYTENV